MGIHSISIGNRETGQDSVINPERSTDKLTLQHLEENEKLFEQKYGIISVIRC